MSDEALVARARLQVSPLGLRDVNEDLIAELVDAIERLTGECAASMDEIARERERAEAAEATIERLTRERDEAREYGVRNADAYLRAWQQRDAQRRRAEAAEAELAKAREAMADARVVCSRHASGQVVDRLLSRSAVDAIDAVTTADASDAGERAGKLDATLAEVERLKQIGVKCAIKSETNEHRAKTAEAALARAREALEWYAWKVADCRKIGADGDDARTDLDADGGRRARAALAPEGK